MFSISQRTMLAAAVFAATTGAALAQAVDPAQVRAEATAANKAGLVARGEIGAPVPQTFTSTLSSAEVRAEGKAAHAAHQDAHGDQAIPEPATVSTRNRAEVKAETAKAVRAGQVSRGEMG
jgi:hypothetical protein